MPTCSFRVRARKNGQTWKGTKPHMGYNQEAYDAECAALARALESASRRNTIPERVTISTDAQAAIRRMASDEPGPGEQYAIQVRKHIAVQRRARPGITIEIRWCPAHKGVAGNEKADEWAAIAAEEPDTRGVKWLSYSARQRCGQCPSRGLSQTLSGRSPRRSGRRLGSRLEADLHWTKNRTSPQCWWCRYPTQTREHLFKVNPEWKAQQKILWVEVREETGRWKSRWKIRDLLADEM
jgi:ribonuclease HI